MKTLHGSGNRILEADLSSRKVEIYEVSEKERKTYLGGKGLGLKLLFDRMESGIDPLEKDNMLAFMPGVLMGTGAPCSGRFHALGKSPLTGIMTSSSCGGPFGMALKTAGWDGLLISGMSESPVWLRITPEGITFEDAADLWGTDIFSTQERILTGKKDGALVIGPAGENLVRFANIASGERFLGRGGMGAVMGSKKLKAVAALGGAYKICPADEKEFDYLRKVATRYINSNEMTGVYRQYGTSSNVLPCSRKGLLPVNNFSDGTHEKAANISGQHMSGVHSAKHHTCKPCKILCGKKGSFGGRTLPVPEYETVGLMGSNIGVFDSEKIGEWNQICAETGMDTISAGGTLAWVMEASEKGLFKSQLRFGSPDGVSQALYDIAYAREDGKDMGLGTRALSEKYGGKEFAIHVKGLEMAAYDPRGAFGQGLAYAVANRGGCHLSAYVVSLEILFGLLNPLTAKAKPEFVRLFESITCCINSLQTCQFTMFAYTLEPPLAKYTPSFLLGFLMQHIPRVAVNLVDFSMYRKLWSAVTGIKISNKEFLRAGDRIHVLERYMNCQDGISRKDDILPFRLLNEPRKSDSEGMQIPLEDMLDAYYRLREYDENGIPTQKCLEQLGIRN